MNFKSAFSTLAQKSGEHSFETAGTLLWWEHTNYSFLCRLDFDIYRLDIRYNRFLLNQNNWSAAIRCMHRQRLQLHRSTATVTPMATQATRYCPNCGAPVQPNTTFCPNCGKPAAATKTTFLLFFLRDNASVRSYLKELNLENL